MGPILPLVQRPPDAFTISCVSACESCVALTCGALCCVEEVEALQAAQREAVEGAGRRCRALQAEVEGLHTQAVKVDHQLECVRRSEAALRAALRDSEALAVSVHLESVREREADLEQAVAAAGRREAALQGDITSARALVDCFLETEARLQRQLAAEERLRAEEGEQAAQEGQRAVEGLRAAESELGLTRDQAARLRADLKAAKVRIC